MCVCLSMYCVVLCVGRGLASGRSPVQGVLPIVYRFISKNPLTPQGKRERLRKKDTINKSTAMYHIKYSVTQLPYILTVCFQFFKADISYNSSSHESIFLFDL
jgi:hypothetical protein